MFSLQIYFFLCFHSFSCISHILPDPGVTLPFIITQKFIICSRLCLLIISWYDYFNYQKKKYQQRVDRAVSIFKNKFGVTDVIKGWHDGLYPGNGHLHMLCSYLARQTYLYPNYQDKNVITKDFDDLIFNGTIARQTNSRHLYFFTKTIPADMPDENTKSTINHSFI